MNRGARHAPPRPRILEAAVGEALGPAKKGPGNLPRGEDIEVHLRHEFRLLANGRERWPS